MSEFYYVYMYFNKTNLKMSESRETEKSTISVGYFKCFSTTDSNAGEVGPRIDLPNVSAELDLMDIN